MPSISAAAVLLTFVLRALSVAVPKVAPVGAIPGQYIVRLKPGLQASDIQSHLDWAVDAHRRSPQRRDTTGLGKSFSIGRFNAYTGSFDDDSIAEISAAAGVHSVEPNRFVEPDVFMSQSSATWGLASLSSPNQLPDTSNVYSYAYDRSSGAGTFVYVVDTGVQISHPDFAGRAVKGYNAQPDEEFDDFGGHGTHTAGVVGSQTYGVVKRATIVDVKVLAGGGSGTVENVLDGYNWAVNNITQTPGRLGKSVISMSLGFAVSSRTSALEDAVKAAYDLGVVTVVSAGNGNQDAAGRSPARAEHAFTVAAADWNRNRAGFSNYGASVEIFAPGVDIKSLGLDNGYATRSGTSQATPFVAGLVAYLMSKEGLTTPKALLDRVTALAISDVVQDSKGAGNLLAYNGRQGVIVGTARRAVGVPLRV
ncbi:hypothetical protein CkaCkLH20_01404 [Colletotrichum karsti]|uniref:Alkaline protease 1 n=1 Tax=Colletotrichum karsti TaxID=1095194 RepID=A0A9P6IEA0_9PEZI|nr:uncharacterized protein CkaCkLH20_01404 [Colletotrichum karsti]KAF9881254.1 hypothetical protein CkaCkLH20_01404 [Colletotrichum karsti]